MPRFEPLFATLAIASVLLGSTSISTSSRREDYRVGDVMYSVLPPVQFKALHGASWRLMDGSNVNGTSLCQDQAICTLPDARGVFIRGMNLGRDPSKGDAAGDAPMGRYQEDSLKAHSHLYQEWRWQVNTGSGPYPDGLTANVGNKPAVATTGGPNGTETRPRNIALFTYIKVDA